MKEPSRFLPFLPDSSSFFQIFPDFFPFFWQFFSLSGVALCPLDPTVATPLLITLTVLLWVMQSYHTSPVRRIISLAVYIYLSLNTSNLTNQTNLECIVFLKIPLSLDRSAQMIWDKDHNLDYQIYFKKIYSNMVKNKGMYF